MKALLIILLVLPVMAFGQFHTESGSMFPQQSQTSAPEVDSTSHSSFLGLNLSNFSMHQSASFSMMSFGGQTLGVNALTNTFQYDFSKTLRARADVSLIYSPINTLGSSVANQINGLQLSNLSLDYSPSKNFKVSVSMQRNPYLMNGLMNAWDVSNDQGQSRDSRDDEK